jgi:hypothetical protein
MKILLILLSLRHIFPNHIHNLESTELNPSEYIINHPVQEFTNSAKTEETINDIIRNLNDSKEFHGQQISKHYQLPKLTFEQNDQIIQNVNYKAADNILIYNYFKNDESKTSTINCKYMDILKHDIKLETKNNNSDIKNIPFQKSNFYLSNGVVYLATFDLLETNLRKLDEIITNFKNENVLNIFIFTNRETKQSFLFTVDNDFIYIYEIIVKTENEFDFTEQHQINHKEIKETDFISKVNNFAIINDKIVLAIKSSGLIYIWKKDDKYETKTIPKFDDLDAAIVDTVFLVHHETTLMYAIIQNYVIIYDLTKNEIVEKLLKHPKLLKLDYIVNPDVDIKTTNLFIGVFVDNSQKEVNEILIEFITNYKGLSPKVNRIYTSSIKGSFNYQSVITDAISRVTYLFYKKDLYLIKRAVPNLIQIVGFKINLTDVRKESSLASMTIYSNIISRYNVLKLQFKEKTVLLGNLNNSDEFSLSCKFNKVGEYKITELSYILNKDRNSWTHADRLTSLSSLIQTINLKVNNDAPDESIGSTVWLVIAIIFIVVILVAIILYIRKVRRRAEIDILDESTSDSLILQS